MPQLCVRNFAISLDGYGAGPRQDRDNPIGVGGFKLHEWIFVTRSFGATHAAAAEGGTGLDDDFIARGDTGIGATIMGRNMFGPMRGAWGDAPWTGWWGDNPPYHHPVFVLTHHARPPIEMQGGTTFHFVADGIESARGQALDAAGGADVRLGGGVATIQQFLRARLVDELHLVLVPVLLGGGERLFDNVDGAAGDYECVEFVASPSVVHARLALTPT